MAIALVALSDTIASLIYEHAPNVRVEYAPLTSYNRALLLGRRELVIG